MFGMQNRILDAWRAEGGSGPVAMGRGDSG